MSLLSSPTVSILCVNSVAEVGVTVRVIFILSLTNYGECHDIKVLLIIRRNYIILLGNLLSFINANALATEV